jgi:methylmalonyl-CoA/ethylmalonyl-CoA epimerase
MCGGAPARFPAGSLVRICYLTGNGQDTIGTFMDVRRLHHITIAVRDVEQAQATFAALFGAEASGAAQELDTFGARSLDATLANTALEFVAPASADSALERFLERKGEGVYSIALEVADLDAAVRELQERGVRVSDPVDVSGARSAFVTMAATHGVSVQLVEAGSETPEAGSETVDRSETPEAGGQAPDPGDRTSEVGGQIPDPASEMPLSGEPVPPVAPHPRVLDLTPDEWSDTD